MNSEDYINSYGGKAGDGFILEIWEFKEYCRRNVDYWRSLTEQMERIPKNRSRVKKI